MLNMNRKMRERSRDVKGRFLPESKIKEELKSQSDRPRKIIKVKDSYNSYMIKDVWLSEVDKEIIIVLGIFGVLAIIF